MSDRTHEDEAARWFLRLQDPSADSTLFLEWQRWLNAAAEHRIAYEEIEETILGMRRVPAPPLPTADELAADTYDGSVPVADFINGAPAETERSRRASARRFLPYALAAGICGAALLSAWPWFDTVRDERYGAFAYATDAGERNMFTLPDGSRITLDADSALDVAMTPQQRSLKLTRGEAYFQVSKDPARPFVVTAGGAQVRAIGTSFNVRMSDKRTVVAVVEGRVEVTSSGSHHGPVPPTHERGSNASAAGSTPVRRLAAGESVAYIEDGALNVLPASAASIATTWLDGRRQYRNEPLRYVLADVDRYTGRRIEVADAATGDLQFTGTLNLDNSDGWLKGLSIALPVTIAEQPDGALRVSFNAPQ